MRFRTLLILSLFGTPAVLLCQTRAAGWTLPPGFVDGSKNPELIPDTAAYRLVFLSLTVSPSADEKALAKQGALLAQVGLSEPDATTMKQTVAAFGNDYSAWRARSSSVAIATQSEAERTALVRQYQTLLFAKLSANGAVQLVQFVQRAKKRMAVRP